MLEIISLDLFVVASTHAKRLNYLRQYRRSYGLGASQFSPLRDTVVQGAMVFTWGPFLHCGVRALLQLRSGSTSLVLNLGLLLSLGLLFCFEFGIILSASIWGLVFQRRVRVLYIIFEFGFSYLASNSGQFLFFIIDFHAQRKTAVFTLRTCYVSLYEKPN